MPDSPNKYVVTICLILLVGVGVFNVLSPVLVAQAVPASKYIGTGKALRVSAAQGFTKFASTAYFTAYSRVAAGTINVFSNFQIGSGSVVYTTFGICSDTPGTNVTLTATKQYSVVYTTTGAGTQRLVYSRFGDPSSVSGSSSYTYNPATGVLTVTTSGASTVTISWVASTPSGTIYTGLWDALSFLPLVFLLFVLGMYKIGVRGSLMEVILVIAIVGAVAWMLYGMGL